MKLYFIILCIIFCISAVQCQCRSGEICVPKCCGEKEILLELSCHSSASSSILEHFNRLHRKYKVIPNQTCELSYQLETFKLNEDGTIYDNDMGEQLLFSEFCLDIDYNNKTSTLIALRCIRSEDILKDEPIETTFSLRCYDCGPGDKGCEDPENNNIKTTECDEEAANRQSVFRKVVGAYEYDDENACFTMDFEADPGSQLISGLYKGCGKNRNLCKYELPPGTQGKIKNCEKCIEDRCNGNSGVAGVEDKSNGTSRAAGIENRYNGSSKAAGVKDRCSRSSETASLSFSVTLLLGIVLCFCKL